jgi:hypothetical protein
MRGPFRVCRREGKRNGEGRALAQATGNGDAATHGADQLVDDPQADAKAAALVSGDDLLEPPENARLLVSLTVS